MRGGPFEAPQRATDVVEWFKGAGDDPTELRIRIMAAEVAERARGDEPRITVVDAIERARARAAAMAGSQSANTRSKLTRARAISAIARRSRFASARLR